MRLFVAFELDEMVRSRLVSVQNALRRSCDGVRWIPDSQLHLTVKFLGEIPDRDVAAISEAVTLAAKAASPFELTIAGCGCFPPRGLVRIIWAGAGEPTGSMVRCAEAVERAVQEFGIPPERKPFSAHITLGRVREDRSGGRIRASVGAHPLGEVRQELSSLTLMSSVLSRSGPTYAPVATALLGL